MALRRCEFALDAGRLDFHDRRAWHPRVCGDVDFLLHPLDVHLKLSALAKPQGPDDSFFTLSLTLFG